MRFGRDRAETHCPGGETPDDLGLRLDFFEGDGSGSRFERQQTSKVRFSGIGLVDVVGKSPVGVFIICSCSRLEVGHGLRVPHVAVASKPPMKVPRVGQDGFCNHLSAGEPDGVASLHFLREYLKSSTFDTTRGTGKGSIDDFLGKADGLEDLRSFV